MICKKNWKINTKVVEFLNRIKFDLLMVKEKYFTVFKDECMKEFHYQVRLIVKYRVRNKSFKSCPQALLYKTTSWNVFIIDFDGE